MKTRLGSFLVWALYAFGTICVVLALLYWLLSFYASLPPETTHFYAGKANWRDVPIPETHSGVSRVV